MEPGLTFAGLLRKLRAEVWLTQEELAESAQLSSRSISALERGIHRTAHKETARLLADALGLAGPARDLFVAAARGKARPDAVLETREDSRPDAIADVATCGLPRDIAAFTGRETELAQLTSTLTRAVGAGVVAIHAVDGMAGIGKTTFVVHAAHRLAAGFPDGQIFLPLHGHTPGQRPADPADALASLLLTAGVPGAQIPPGLDARATCWRGRMAGKKVLLLLDDAISHEQVRPLLPGTAGSLVLVTSRRRLAALDDAAVTTLDPLPPAEAAFLLARLAGRADISEKDPGADHVTRLCGYLPLAIGMLASRLRHHPAQSCAELAAELAAARDRLAIMCAENLSVEAAFDLSYQDLPAGPLVLFRRLGLIPGPSIDAYSAAALEASTLSQARRHLNELYDHHLITETTPGCYRLHDLLREHARAMAASDLPDSESAMGRLLDYYAHAALTAGRHIAFWSTSRVIEPHGHPPAAAPALASRKEAVAWLEAERLNLSAAVSCAASTGRPRHAVALAAALAGFLRGYGPWDQAADLHQVALAAARQAGDSQAEASAFKELGAAQWLGGDYQAATASLTQAISLYGDIDDGLGQAFAYSHLGLVQEATADYPAAAASHQQALARGCAAGDRLTEAGALTDLGVIQRLTGDYVSAAASQEQALELCRRLGSQPGVAWVLNEIGILRRLSGDFQAAAASQRRALAIFCGLGERSGQACVLNELGMIQQQTGDYPAAAASHQQALERYRFLGYRHGQAETLNSLGELSSRTAASLESREHHIQALAIACDIGAPLQEARALEGIATCHLRDGAARRAVLCWRRALSIYQRIGVPEAERLQTSINHYEPAKSCAAISSMSKL